MRPNIFFEKYWLDDFSDFDFEKRKVFGKYKELREIELIKNSQKM